jgi:hypothetical protein
MSFGLRLAAALRAGLTFPGMPLSPYRVADVLRIADRDPLSMRAEELAALADQRTVVGDTYLPSKVGQYGEVVPEHRHYLHARCTEWIRVKEDITRKADAFRRSRFGTARVVGIHYRATDKIKELIRKVGLPESAIGGIDEYIDAAIATPTSTSCRSGPAPDDRQPHPPPSRPAAQRRAPRSWDWKRGSSHVAAKWPSAL